MLTKRKIRFQNNAKDEMTNFNSSMTNVKISNLSEKCCFPFIFNDFFFFLIEAKIWRKQFLKILPAEVTKISILPKSRCRDSPTCFLHHSTVFSNWKNRKILSQSKSCHCFQYLRNFICKTQKRMIVDMIVDSYIR